MESENNKDKFDKKYGKALHKMKTMIAESCPDAEVLLQFYLNELSREDAGKIQRHVDICPDCLLALTHVEHAAQAPDAIPENWPKIEQEMDRRVYSFLDSKATGPVQSSAISNWPERLLDGIRRLVEIVTPKPVAYAGLMAVVLIGIVYSYAYFSRPPYFDLAQPHLEPAGAIRSAASTETALQQGIQSLDGGHYSQAIERLKAAISASPDNYTANHYLGLAYLMDARKSLPGLAYDYNTQKVYMGTKYLHDALSLAGDNAFYLEDDYWYLAKAALMEGNTSAARVYLGRILELQRPGLMRKDAARKLLDALK